jgi:hypothetical protein
MSVTKFINLIIIIIILKIKSYIVVVKILLTNKRDNKKI